MKTSFVACFTLAMGLLPAGAQDVEIKSFHSSGALTWSAPSNSVCTVEWADSLAPTASWKRSWNTISGLLMTTSNASAHVPMFYRVMCNTNPPVMITPYVLESDMKWVRQGYSTSTNCPWEFEHDGVDFQPNGTLAPFRAVCSGTITELCLRKSPPGDGGDGNWDVYVELTYDPTWSITYNFEPKTSNLSDGINQLTNMTVSLLQEVAQGDTIGRLHQGDSSAHVHFSVLKNGYIYHNGVVVSPKPFFNQEAVTSIMRLTTNRFENATDFCYP